LIFTKSGYIDTTKWTATNRFVASIQDRLKRSMAEGRILLTPQLDEVPPEVFGLPEHPPPVGFDYSAYIDDLANYLRFYKDLDLAFFKGGPSVAAKPS
jgi:hypothetical protein